MDTGFVTTARVTHATPAALYAHSYTRFGKGLYRGRKEEKSGTVPDYLCFLLSDSSVTSGLRFETSEIVRRPAKRKSTRSKENLTSLGCLHVVPAVSVKESSKPPGFPSASKPHLECHRLAVPHASLCRQLNLGCFPFLFSQFSM